MFVPRDHNFTPDVEPASVDVLQPLFEQLEAMPTGTVVQLSGFLDAWSETACWVDDYTTQSRISFMQFGTEEATARWKRVCDDVLPQAAKWQARLTRKLLESTHVAELADGPTDHSSAGRA